MPLAITEDHRDLAEMVAHVATDRSLLEGARALLESDSETLPDWWGDAAKLGWQGVHLDASLEELVVVVEQLGRVVAPGPFVPTVVVSAFLQATGDPTGLLPGLADGSVVGGFGFGETVLGAELADVLLITRDDDVLVLDRSEVEVETRPNLDPTRRTARVKVTATDPRIVPGARQTLIDLSRVILATEAVGIAAACTDMAADYAKTREQFGRPIAMFQAVKHHCANMAVATELATSLVWDAARAASTGGDQLTFAAAAAAVAASDAADLCVNLNTQVHGGIAITWEHDAHLFVRRAGVLSAFLRPDGAAADLARLTAAGVSRAGSVELPPEAEPFREEVRAFLADVDADDEAGLRQKLIESGYIAPHWPRPFGRDAGAVEQLVIEGEFAKAGIKRPNLSITGWVVLTLLQNGTPEQVERYVAPALAGETVWCQLFSEPGAGSDAASIRTRAVPADGGWIVNGQKVWTTHAHKSRYGLATVRTDPDAPKHNGITTMVIDMQAPGVTVRPLKMTSGESEFNEVFFDDVFVAAEDVVGEINAGWTVARATLGNESVSIGGDDSMIMPGSMFTDLLAQHPGRLYGGDVRVGRYIATTQAVKMLNVRSAYRAVAGGGPGPEGAVTKLMQSELGHEAQAMLAELAGDDVVFTDGEAMMSSMMRLLHRAMSIAGGTSEIKRNQIGERILGLPRDPLVT